MPLNIFPFFAVQPAAFRLPSTLNPMPLFIPKESDFQEVFVEGKNKRVLSRSKFEAFNASLLGLGDLTLPANQTDAVAAVFTLEGYADFCRQIEPHPVAQL